MGRDKGEGDAKPNSLEQESSQGVDRCRVARHPVQMGIHSAMSENFYVYILASKRNGTLYIGVTPDLVKRVWEHKNDFVSGFTKKYGVKNLAWYEVHEDSLAAITVRNELRNGIELGR